jgi:hypothetical protein
MRNKITWLAGGVEYMAEIKAQFIAVIIALKGQ